MTLKSNSPFGQEQNFGFEYDDLNRLTRANYSSDGVYIEEENEYGTAYSYKDNRGNFQSIQRRGRKKIGNNSYEYTTIDDLQMIKYEGANQLIKVKDYGEAELGYLRSSERPEIEYGYSGGNIVSDPSRGILSIEYNILDLPEHVEFEDESYTCRILVCPVR